MWETPVRRENKDKRENRAHLVLTEMMAQRERLAKKERQVIREPMVLLGSMRSRVPREMSVQKELLGSQVNVG